MDAYICRTHTILAALVAAAALAFGAVLAQASTITVQPGETLSELAARHGVTVGAIAGANGLPDVHTIIAGANLTIPDGVSATEPSSSSSSSSATGGHEVAAGDTLSAIAARHGVTVDALAAANGLSDPDTIIAGRSLTIPAGGASSGADASAETPAASSSTSASSSPSSSSAAGGYRMAAGDSLSAIAARNGVTVGALVSANGLSDPDTIVAGRSLTIPAASAAAAASVTPGESASVPAGMVPVDRSVVGSMITSAADRHGVDPALARAIAWQESGWNHAVVSSAGALGVMQLMPDTARWLETDVMGRSVDPRSVSENIDGGVALLGWLQNQTGGDTRTTIAAYYQGLAGVRQRGWFDDTKDYVDSVLALRGRV